MYDCVLRCSHGYLRLHHPPALALSSSPHFTRMGRSLSPFCMCYLLCSPLTCSPSVVCAHSANGGEVADGVLHGGLEPPSSLASPFACLSPSLLFSCSRQRRQRRNGKHAPWVHGNLHPLILRRSCLSFLVEHLLGHSFLFVSPFSYAHVPGISEMLVMALSCCARRGHTPSYEVAPYVDSRRACCPHSHHRAL